MGVRNLNKGLIFQSEMTGTQVKGYDVRDKGQENQEHVVDFRDKFQEPRLELRTLLIEIRNPNKWLRFLI